MLIPGPIWKMIFINLFVKKFETENIIKQLNKANHIDDTNLSAPNGHLFSGAR